MTSFKIDLTSFRVLNVLIKILLPDIYTHTHNVEILLHFKTIQKNVSTFITCYSGVVTTFASTSQTFQGI